MTPAEQLHAVFAACVDDPALFFRAILRAPLRKWQADLCAEITARLKAGERHLRVHVRSCHGAGKTYFAAGLGQWWLSTRPESRVLTTAPTWAGVENLLWPEIARLYNGSLLRDLRFGRLLTTKLEVREGWYAVGASSDRSENLEGHHSPVAAMRIVDEAKAVEDGIFDATAGMLDAPETLDLWISTPSIRTGRYYERDVNGGEGVIRCVVTAADLVADGVPGKAEWAAESLRQWGEDSPEYQSRVLARYVDDAEGALFPLSWIDRAMAQEWTVDGPLLAGFDVAGSKDGDESVVALAAGADPEQRAEIKGLTPWRERDTMVSKGRAKAAASGAPLRVDGIGLGKGVLDSLAEDGYTVEEYRASDKPHDETRFANRKAEDAWGVRKRLEAGLLRLPKDKTLKSQLAAMRYKILPSGKLQVVDPSDSPDRADAVIIALAGRRAASHDGWLELIERRAA